MKAFTIVLGLFAAIAVSDVVSAALDVATCGNHRAVRCIGLKGDALEDTDATMMALKQSSNERVCECQRDKNHLYVVAENDNHFIQIMNECKTFAYRGKTCI
ncbi:hypothetical protein BGZ75_008225 [Mortierella antarctica]|nr:hypothetical protein BGZ75_008225 [Mortierella antarctica]